MKTLRRCLNNQLAEKRWGFPLRACKKHFQNLSVQLARISFKRCLSLLVVLHCIAFASKVEGGQNCYLDVHPLKYNTLAGYTHILVAPQYSIKDRETARRVEERIALELKKIGDVVRLPLNDVTGLGSSDSILVFDVQALQTLNGANLDQSLGSLSLFASFPIPNLPRGKVEVWSAQGVVSYQADLDPKLTMDLVDSLLRKFTGDYQRDNPKKKATFYMYTSA